MDPLHLLFLLFCMASSFASGDCSEDDNETNEWSKQSLPVVLDRHTEALSTPSFRGHGEEEDGQGSGTVCGIECQSAFQPLDQAKQERILGYETVYGNGTRTRTEVTLRGFLNISRRWNARTPAPTRTRRQVYGVDGRFVISDSQFITNYPFSTTVRLSTGCSGVLVSPKHVLTAAHCVHDGRDYLEGVQRLRVGMLQLKAKRGRGGRRRGGRGRGGRRGKGETVEEERKESIVDEGLEQNSLDVDQVRGRLVGRKGVWRTGRKGGDEGRVGERSLNRVPRSATPKKEPVFRWTRVKQTRIPNGWIQTESSTDSGSLDYDYALLELKRPVKQKHMELGVAPADKSLARIHFSGYDGDKGMLAGHGDERVIYRFCSVTKESDDLMYQQCDAQHGATGAGVYIRRRQEAGGAGRKGTWQRKVIGVFSGHRWVELEGGEQRDFNVAVRITPPKFAQICHWIHGDPSMCKEL